MVLDTLLAVILLIGAVGYLALGLQLIAGKRTVGTLPIGNFVRLCRVVGHGWRRRTHVRHLLHVLNRPNFPFRRNVNRACIGLRVLP